MASQVLLTARVTPTSGGCADNMILSCTAGGALHVLTVGTSLSGSLSQNIMFLGGQAITLAAGAVAAGTQRITLASNDPGVVALQVIDNFVGTDGGATHSGVAVVAGQDPSNNAQALACGTDGVLGANVSQLAGYTINLGVWGPRHRHPAGRHREQRRQHHRHQDRRRDHRQPGRRERRGLRDGLHAHRWRERREPVRPSDRRGRARDGRPESQPGHRRRRGDQLGLLDNAVGVNGSAVPANASGAVIQIGGSDGTNLRTLKISAAGALFTEQNSTPAGHDATNDWVETCAQSHYSATLADNAAATVDGTDEAGSDIILPSTYVGNYRGFTCWVKNTGSVALNHVYVYASKDGTLWTKVDVIKNDLELLCDALAGSNAQGICWTVTDNPGWLYIKAAATVASSSTTAFGTVSYQM